MSGVTWWHIVPWQAEFSDVPVLGEGTLKACTGDDITAVIIEFPYMRHLASSQQVLLLALRKEL